MKKRFSLTLISSLLIASGYLYATPYLSILSFKMAIDNKNPEKAEKFIDFPSVRENMKTQISKELSTKAERQIADRPYKQFTMLIVQPVIKAVVSSTINATVTPTGLSSLITKGTLTKPQKTNSKITEGKNKDNKNKISLFYKDLNIFVLKSELENSDEVVIALWKRERFSHWRLYSIELPKSLINAM